MAFLKLNLKLHLTLFKTVLLLTSYFLLIRENSYRQKHDAVIYTYLFLEDMLPEFIDTTFGIEVKHAQQRECTAPETVLF